MFLDRARGSFGTENLAAQRPSSPRACVLRTSVINRISFGAPPRRRITTTAIRTGPPISEPAGKKKADPARWWPVQQMNEPTTPQPDRHPRFSSGSRPGAGSPARVGGVGGCLLPGRGAEPGHHAGGHAAAVLELDALFLGPGPHVLGVDVARCVPAPGPARRPSAAADAPGRGHVAAESRPQFLGVLGVQVDLVIGTVQPELNTAFCFAPIEIVDEEGLYFLRNC